MPGADPPRASRVRANSTVLHVEVRGSGPPVLPDWYAAREVIDAEAAVR